MLGDLYLLKNEYDKAFDFYQKTDDEDIKFYLLGELYLKNKEYKKATDYIKKRALYNKKLGDMGALAENYISLSKCYFEIDKEKAIEKLMIGVNTLQHLNIKLSSKEKVIEETILSSLTPQEAIAYNKKYMQKILTTDKTKFLNPDLDKELISSDGKKMILIPQGLSFFGDGDRKNYCPEDILENMDKIIDGNFFTDSAKELFLYNYYIDETLVTLNTHPLGHHCA